MKKQSREKRAMAIVSFFLISRYLVKMTALAVAGLRERVGSSPDPLIARCVEDLENAVGELSSRLEDNCSSLEIVRRILNPPSDRLTLAQLELVFWVYSFINDLIHCEGHCLEFQAVLAKEREEELLPWVFIEKFLPDLEPVSTFAVNYLLDRKDFSPPEREIQVPGYFEDCPLQSTFDGRSSN